MFEQEKEAIENVQKLQGITPRQYVILSTLFNIMNSYFFDSVLPDVLFILSYENSSRLGFFCPSRFSSKEGDKSVIAMNPEYFSRDVQDCCSTLLHEMCHEWEYVEKGKIPGGYHDKIWAGKMKECGLEPVYINSHRTKVTHTVIEGGKFNEWFKQFSDVQDTFFLIKSELLNITGNNGSKKVYTKKTKYECPSCGALVWGKPGMRITCQECEEEFEEQ